MNNKMKSRKWVLTVIVFFLSQYYFVFKMYTAKENIEMTCWILGFYFTSNLIKHGIEKLKNVLGCKK